MYGLRIKISYEFDTKMSSKQVLLNIMSIL